MAHDFDFFNVEDLHTVSDVVNNGLIANSSFQQIQLMLTHRIPLSLVLIMQVLVSVSATRQCWEAEAHESCPTFLEGS